MKRFERPEQFALVRRSFYSFGGPVGKRRVRLPILQSADFAENASAAGGQRVFLEVSGGCLPRRTPHAMFADNNKINGPSPRRSPDRPGNRAVLRGEETTWHSIMF